MRISLHMRFRLTSTLGHENPLGLPRSGSVPRMQRGLPERRRILNVAKVVAVSSAKGGVGKSTVAANLAVALARLGQRTGILDTDLFGPSIPSLFGLNQEPELSENNQLLPLTNYGVKTMSMGYLVGEGAPVVWRGLMVMKALQQLLHQVDWRGLDVLVLDLPPGTGDTQLTISQQVEIDADAVRGLHMFNKMQVSVLGLVRNMAVMQCEACGHAQAVFGGGGVVDRLCAEHGLPLLADIPLKPAIMQEGKLAAAHGPDGDGAAFYGLAEGVLQGLGSQSAK